MHTCRRGTDASNSGLAGRVATAIMGTEERMSNDGVTEIDCTLETTPTIGVTGCFTTNNRLPRPARGGGGGGPERRKGFAKGRSFGGLACWAWVLPWVLLVLGGMEGVKGVAIPDCTYAAYNTPPGTCMDASCNNVRTCGIRQAVDTYTTQVTIDKYGPIEDWDTSLVTDMSRVFDGKSTFNANISAWLVGKVTTMAFSTYLLFSSPVQDRVFFWLLLYPFFFLWQQH